MRAGVSRSRVLVSSAFLAFSPGLARAQSTQGDDLLALRAELAALQRQVSELSARIDALAAPPPVPPSPAPLPPAPSQQPPSPAPYPTSGPASSKVFNPDIAVVGDFIGAVGEPGSQDSEPSLELHEAEVSFQAVVDPYARADFFFAYGDGEVEVEEGYITFPTLPGGLLAKAGKTRDVFGKVNALHNHSLPFTDRPLVAKNLTGGEEGLSDYGITLSRLFPNSFVFLEATGQVYRGRSEIFDGTSRSDLAYVGHLRAYRDLSESTNVDLGGSFAYGGNDSGPGFHTRLVGADATLRWRPLRRSLYNRFLARTELVWSRREDPEATHDAFGFYVSGEYQLARRWFLGARYDFSERATDPTLTDQGGSALLTFWPSEWSQVRGQYRHTRYGEGQTANEFLFQLIFSIGAHGAHPF
jgi:hypothetical protein